MSRDLKISKRPQMHVLTHDEREKAKKSHYAYGKFLMYVPELSQAKRRRRARQGS